VQSSSHDRLGSIQVLRGIAAMAVVFNHAGLLVLGGAAALGTSFLIPAEALVRLGAVGVDLFFVISGFVMALSATKFAGLRGAGLFLLHRYNRIAPLYYLFSLVLLADRLRASVPTDKAVVLNSFTIIPFLDGAQYSWTLHFLGWTLAFEFIFYLLVAVLIAAHAGARGGLLLAVMVAAPLAALLPIAGNIAWTMATNPILWEFALGVLAYLLWQRGLLARLRTLLAVAAFLSLGLLAAPFLLYPEVDPLSVGATVHASMAFERVFFWGIPSFLCFCLAVSLDAGVAGSRTGGGLPERLRQSQVLRLLGDASYSIYLSHLLVMIVAAKGVALIPEGRLPTGSADLVLVGLLAVSAVVGVLVYRWAEKPMLDLGQGWIRWRFERAPVASPQAAMLRARDARRRVRSEWEL
jgi:peptidoglycan/LPS O-acetylase OafA/YrhL